MKKEHVDQCQFPHWYPLFSQFTFKSEIIDLSAYEKFVEWLKKGEFTISTSAFPVQHSTSFEELNDPDSAFTCDDYEEEEDCTVFEGKEKDIASEEWYQKLKEESEVLIEKLGGSVFPKINWSSPRDAVWMTHNNSIKCTKFEDILLLLKSSDFVASDLSEAYIHCTKPGSQLTTDHNADDNHDFDCSPEKIYLILRKWYELNPAFEFRCFVSHHQIIGISQRSSNYYKFLSKSTPKFKDLIFEFYKKAILNQFGSHSFVFDVYVDKRDRVWLVDFNPFGRRTDALLFSWEELFAVHLLLDQKYQNDREYYSILREVEGESEFLDFRLIEGSSQIQNTHFGHPGDFSVSSPEGLERLIQIQREQELEYQKSQSNDD